jgi:hypothetical protein
MPVLPGANRNRTILALKRAIEATFDDGKWRELGYLTDNIEIIEGHPRLLRSLYWGDDDYGGNILQVLPTILGEDLENLKEVERFVDLEDWLLRNDEGLHTELYGSITVPLEEIERVGEVHDVLEFNQQISRIRISIPNDPALAVGSAKELLETVLKTILQRYGAATSTSDLPTLIDTSTRQGQITRRTLNNLCQIVTGVGEVRNLVGTGHGRSRGSQVDSIHARLVVNSAAALAIYLLEIWEAQRRP